MEMKNFYNIFCRNILINILILTFSFETIKTRSLIFLIGVTLIISAVEEFIYSENIVKKFSFRVRIMTFLIITILVEVGYFRFLMIFNNKEIFIGILFYLVLYIVYIKLSKMKLSKEEEELNKGLEIYKQRKFKEDFIKMYEESKLGRTIRAILFINEEMNENKHCSEATYFCKISNRSFQLFDRNLITNSVLKLSKEILFTEIDSVKLTIGNMYETKAPALIYPRHNYEGKEEEIRFRNDGRLSIEITLINGEVIRILTGNIRESFIYVKKILEENSVSIIDEYNLDKVLLEKNDKEMYEYINNYGKF